MRIICERCKVTTACAGMEGLDAEIHLELEGGKRLYLHENCYEGTHFSVAETSIYDFLTSRGNVEDPGEVEFIEEYDSLEEAVSSKYYGYFKKLDSMTEDLVLNKSKCKEVSIIKYMY